MFGRLLTWPGWDGVETLRAGWVETPVADAGRVAVAPVLVAGRVAAAAVPELQPRAAMVLALGSAVAPPLATLRL